MAWYLQQDCPETSAVCLQYQKLMDRTKPTTMPRMQDPSPLERTGKGTRNMFILCSYAIYLAGQRWAATNLDNIDGACSGPVWQLSAGVHMSKPADSLPLQPLLARQHHMPRCACTCAHMSVPKHPHYENSLMVFFSLQAVLCEKANTSTHVRAHPSRPFGICLMADWRPQTITPMCSHQTMRTLDTVAQHACGCLASIEESKVHLAERGPSACAPARGRSMQMSPAGRCAARSRSSQGPSPTTFKSHPSQHNVSTHIY